MPQHEYDASRHFLAWMGHSHGLERTGHNRSLALNSMVEILTSTSVAYLSEEKGGSRKKVLYMRAFN